MTFETQLQREGEKEVDICCLKHLWFIWRSAQITKVQSQKITMTSNVKYQNMSRKYAKLFTLKAIIKL